MEEAAELHNQLHDLIVKATHIEKPHPIDGAEAWHRLVEGNKLFASGHYGKNLLSYSQGISPERRHKLVSGQQPYAIVVCCSDSRVAPELIFNQGLGNIFIVRAAGNVVNPHALGSIEYAIEHLGSQLVVVLGHSECGAVKAALGTYGQSSGDEHGHEESNIPSILEKIYPAIATVKDGGGDVLSAAVAQNVRNVKAEILEKSKLVGDHVKEGKVAIRTGVYSLSSGLVDEVH